MRYSRRLKVVIYLFQLELPPATSKKALQPKTWHTALDTCSLQDSTQTILTAPAA